jgi:hypothetical protein
MPADASGFLSDRVLAAISALLLVFALLFIVIEHSSRFGAHKAAPRASLRPAITLSNALSAVPARTLPDGTEVYDVTCNVATSDQPHPACITYTRPGTPAPSQAR